MIWRSCSVPAAGARGRLVSKRITGSVTKRPVVAILTFGITWQHPEIITLKKND